MNIETLRPAQRMDEPSSPQPIKTRADDVHTAAQHPRPLHANASLLPNGVQKTVQLKTHPHYKGPLPEYKSQLASGFDVRAQIEQSIMLHSGERVLVPTGLSFALPAGFELQARPRSGWALKKGISLVNTPGTIDADYRGEVKIILINLGQESVCIEPGDRIAQLVLAPVVQAQFECVDVLDSTTRGHGGFGSTGR